MNRLCENWLMQYASFTHQCRLMQLYNCVIVYSFLSIWCWCGKAKRKRTKGIIRRKGKTLTKHKSPRGYSTTILLNYWSIASCLRSRGGKFSQFKPFCFGGNILGELSLPILPTIFGISLFVPLHIILSSVVNDADR